VTIRKRRKEGAKDVNGGEGEKGKVRGGSRGEESGMVQAKLLLLLHKKLVTMSEEAAVKDGGREEWRGNRQYHGNVLGGVEKTRGREFPGKPLTVRTLIEGRKLSLIRIVEVGARKIEQ